MSAAAASALAFVSASSAYKAFPASCSFVTSPLAASAALMASGHLCFQRRRSGLQLLQRALLVLFTTTQAVADKQSKTGIERETSECHERGRVYFRSILSYPRLQDGRDAEMVIFQRCEKSPEAFKVR